MKLSPAKKATNPLKPCKATHHLPSTWLSGTLEKWATHGARHQRPQQLSLVTVLTGWVLRYADVLLMYAEALNELQGADVVGPTCGLTAREALLKVRSRSFDSKQASSRNGLCKRTALEVISSTRWLMKEHGSLPEKRFASTTWFVGDCLTAK